MNCIVVGLTDKSMSPTRTRPHSLSFETDDFSIHYSEQYRTGASWDCQWDRHPNDHNTRAHFHPPPTAPSPGEDAEYPDEWRNVLTTVLIRLDGRFEAFWDR